MRVGIAPAADNGVLFLGQRSLDACQSLRLCVCIDDRDRRLMAVMQIIPPVQQAPAGVDSGGVHHLWSSALLRAGSKAFPPSYARKRQAYRMKRPLQTQPVYYTIFSPCPTRVFRTFGEENLSCVPFSGHKNTEPRLRFGMWYTIRDSNPRHPD